MKPAPPVTNALLKGIISAAPEATSIWNPIPFSGKTQFGGTGLNGRNHLEFDPTPTGS
jgi:hypothetical protein